MRARLEGEMRIGDQSTLEIRSVLTIAGSDTEHNDQRVLEVVAVSVMFMRLQYGEQASHDTRDSTLIRHHPC
jgi:hypothetical protein